MFFLVKREGLLFKKKGVNASFTELIPEDIEVESWKGLYISDQWAGYVYTNMGPFREQEEGSGYIINSISRLHFRMFRELKEMEITSSQILDGSFRLIRFNARISGMTDISISGKRMGSHIMIEIEFNKDKFRRTFEADDDLFLENSILSIYRGRGLKVGDSYTLNIFNPLTLTSEPTTVEVIAEEGGLLVLETEFGGMSSKSWIDKRGHVVKEETSNGWILKEQTKEEIEQYITELTDKGIDILSAVAVKTKRYIGSPREVDYMKIKVTGIDLSRFTVDGTRQVLIDTIDTNEVIIEIRSCMPDEGSAISIPYEGAQFKGYLKPTIWIQSRDPKIRAKAAEIIGGETNSWIAAKRIGRWTYDTIERSFSVGIPLASSVLLYKKGDCNEYTTLFVALARASGIPAEMCAGLVYLDDGFYYHAWPKVYIGEWVHMDPTLGEEIADATHFELVSGDLAAQSRLALTLGKIHIEILDVKTRGEDFEY